MRLPAELRPLFFSLSPEAQISIRTDYSRRRKSKFVAYCAWLFLGWHYLYLKRIGLQFAFWLTAGGLLLWWLIDLFRVGPIVNRMNEDTARELMVQYKALFAKDPHHTQPNAREIYHHREQIVLQPASYVPLPVPNTSQPISDVRLTAPSQALASPPPSPSSYKADSDLVQKRDNVEIHGHSKLASGPSPETHAEPAPKRSHAILLIGAAVMVLAITFSLIDDGEGPSTGQGQEFTTTAQVNVRDEPTTKSSILGKIRDGEKVIGTVETGPNGRAQWLRIEGGDHPGGYVSMSNLK